MEIFEAIRKRYSCRSYLDKPVEKEKLDKIFEAARLAPSAKNLQDRRFVVVTDRGTKQRLAAAANNQTFIADAGVIVVACSICDEKMRCGQRIAPIDVAIALDHISLQATALGLATCWIGSFNLGEVRSIVGVPDGVEIIELMALGYPAGEARHKPREAIDKLVCYEQWMF